MKINKIIYLIAISNFVSCQTKKVINFTKYDGLTLEKKNEVNGYLNDAKMMMTKKENEVALMFQYNCFFDKNIIINNIYHKEFPKTNKIHYGQSIVNFAKNLGNIKIKVSNGTVFSFPQKKGYDYITICYNESSKTAYINYYDYPKLLIEE